MPHVLRQRTVFEDAGLRVLSRRYAPGAAFAPHRDLLSRITLTLAGGFAEDTRYGSARLGAGDVLFKSRTAEHENRYGPDGAVQVSLEFLTEDADGALRSVLEGVWSARSSAALLGCATTLLESASAGDAPALRAAANDLTASLRESPRRGGAPPPWLGALKAELEEAGLSAVDAGARARAAGVHPVHASRLFRACYGVSITGHAQHHAVRRAMREMAGGAGLAETAAAAGFYDQSHMSRVFRRVLGRTPGAQRRIWAAASC